jgi:hypothetical protein
MYRIVYSGAPNLEKQATTLNVRISGVRATRKQDNPLQQKDHYGRGTAQVQSHQEKDRKGVC